VTTKVSSKGQIVIPQRVRRAQGIKEGDDLEVIEEEDGIFLRKLPQNADWLDVLRSCPVKGLKMPPRSKELPPKPPEFKA